MHEVKAMQLRKTIYFNTPHISQIVFISSMATFQNNLKAIIKTFDTKFHKNGLLKQFFTKVLN